MQEASLASGVEESRDSVRSSLAFTALKNDCSFLRPLEPEPEEVTFKASLFTPSWGEGPRVSSGAICLLLLILADLLQPRAGSGQPRTALQRKETGRPPLGLLCEAGLQ